MSGGKQSGHSGNDRVLADANAVLDDSSEKKGLARILPFLGPAFIASVAYVDPVNFATNIAGGAQFGYTLLWVIIISNLMAMLIQSLSAKLGIVTGLNLAEQCRKNFHPVAVGGMWVMMELVAMATDLAEFLGAAVISAFVGVVALSYVIEIFLAKPAWDQVMFHAVVPRFGGPQGLILVTGILGRR